MAVHAFAQPALAVEYKAPDDCVHLPAIRADVTAQLGRDPFAAEASRRAIIEIWHTERGYLAQVDLAEATRSTEHRSFGPFDTCEEATTAVGHAIVAWIDPAHDDPSAPHFVPPPPAAAGRPANSMTVRLEPDEPKHEVGLVLGALTFPGAALVGGVTAGYRFADARASLTARFGASNGNHVTGEELFMSACARKSYVEGCGNLGFGRKDISGGDAGSFVMIGAQLGADVPLTRAIFIRVAGELEVLLPQPTGIDPVDVGGTATLGYTW